MTYKSNELLHAVAALDATSHWNYLHTAQEECPANAEQFKNMGYFKEDERVYKHDLVPFTWEQLEAQLAKSRTAIQWVDLRTEREKRLAETDWKALSDGTLSDEWKTYRQALRDLPANTADPAKPTWPTKPT